MTIRAAFALLITFLLSIVAAQADGIVSAVTSAPVAPNGIVVNERAAINVHLQSDVAPGLAFMDPAIEGYGIPTGGAMEIELVSGFQRDPKIPLDDKALILVAGTPQQGLPASPLGLVVSQGANNNTFKIIAKDGIGRNADQLRSLAKGAKLDPIIQRGIKIIHIGRNSAFVSRGQEGVVEVRIMDGAGNVIASGREAVSFLDQPRPQVYLTNVTHDQRNHNWQRIGRGKIVGAGDGTLPLPLMLYAKNKGLENEGISGSGVISTEQLASLGLRVPPKLARFNAGLIIQDIDGDGLLDPRKDLILGGIALKGPSGAKLGQIVSPIVKNKPFLSSHTQDFHPRAGQQIGGAVMQVVYVAGDFPGIYQLRFTLFKEPGNLDSIDGSSATYSVVVK